MPAQIAAQRHLGARHLEPIADKRDGDRNRPPPAAHATMRSTTNGEVRSDGAASARQNSRTPRPVLANPSTMGEDRLAKA